MRIAPGVIRPPEGGGRRLSPEMRKELENALNELRLGRLPHEGTLDRVLRMHPPPSKELKNILNHCSDSLDHYREIRSDPMWKQMEQQQEQQMEQMDKQLEQQQKQMQQQQEQMDKQMNQEWGEYQKQVQGHVKELSGYLQTH